MPSTGTFVPRLITGYVSSTGAATLDHALPNTPVTGAAFFVIAGARSDLALWQGTAPLALSSQQVQAVIPSSTVVASVTGAVGSISGVTFPTNFSALGISVGGHISNVDTLTTYTNNTPQTGDAYAYLGTNLGALGANATALASATNLAEANADLDEL